MTERQKSSKPTPRVLMLVEVVASADQTAERLTRFQTCMTRYKGHIKKGPGTGFLATFSSPTNAIQCALEFQQVLSPCKVRVGIHMFVPMDPDNAPISEQSSFDKAVDIVVRLVRLAGGGQILLTRTPFDLAREQLSSSPDGSPLEWLAHGDFLFPLARIAFIPVNRR